MYFLAFLFVLILIIILAVVIWKTAFNTSSTSTNSGSTGTRGAFGQACGTGGCDSGLACTNGVCLRVPGTSCSTSPECAFNGVCQSGQCSTTQIAGLNQSCIVGVVPCTSGLTCISGTCKANLGVSCQQSSDCVTGTGCDPSRGVCQNITSSGLPAATGTEGAFCSTSFPCNSGFTCTGGACHFDTSSIQRVPFLGNCSTSDTCSFPLQCLTGQCLFAEPDANRCSTACPVDYECKGNYCRGKTTMPCSTDFFCVSGSCQVSPRLYQFSPAKSEWVPFATVPSTKVSRIATGSGRILIVVPPPTTPDVESKEAGLYLASTTTLTQILPGVLSGTVPQTTQTGTFILLDAAITAHFIYILFNVSTSAGSFRAIYTAPLGQSLSLSNLTPYNVRASGVPGTQVDAQGNVLSIDEIDFIVPPAPGAIESVVVATTAAGKRLFSKRGGVFAYLEENISVWQKNMARPRLTGDTNVPFAVINSGGQLQLRNSNTTYGSTVFDYAINLSGNTKLLWYLNVDSAGVLQINTVTTNGKIVQVIGNIGLTSRIGLNGTLPLLYSPASCS